MLCLIRGQGLSFHITGMTREDINIHHIKYPLNKLTNKTNLLVRESEIPFEMMSHVLLFGME